MQIVEPDVTRMLMAARIKTSLAQPPGSPAEMTKKQKLKDLLACKIRLPQCVCLTSSSAV